MLIFVSFHLSELRFYCPVEVSLSSGGPFRINSDFIQFDFRLLTHLKWDHLPLKRTIKIKRVGMKQERRSIPGKSYWVLKISILAIVLFGEACVHQPLNPLTNNGEQPGTPVTPVPPDCHYDGTVCFESSVLPIFISSCAKTGCHDAATRREGYNLSSYTTIVSRGITPGNANSSKLYRVLFATGEDMMPPDAPLTKAQKDSIALWINQGAKNTTNCNCSCDATRFTYAAVIQPLLSANCVGCHKSGSLGGNIDLSTYATVKVQAANGKLLGSVQHASGYSPMPKGGKLSDCQIAQIKSWIDAGALDN